MISEVMITNEALLLAGLSAVAGVVVMLWAMVKGGIARLQVRADKCEEEHRVCRDRHAVSEKKTAVLEVQVGHLREQLKLPPMPVQPETEAAKVAGA